MSINDDPLPLIKNLVSWKQSIARMTHKIGAWRTFVHVTKAQYKKVFVISGLLLVGVLQQTTTVSSASTQQEGAVTLATQKYTACLLRERIDAPVVQLPLLVNEECLREATRDEVMTVRAEHFRTILKGHPMASMAEALAQQDPQVAAFIVGIGKIESNWGKRSPWKAGQDCYNYWGYKTSGSRGQALGHACFGSPEEAIDTIATRLAYFVQERGKNTAQKLLVWKCGSSCATHDPAGVARWVGVVQTYAQKARAFDDIREKQEISPYLAFAR